MCKPTLIALNLLVFGSLARMSTGFTKAESGDHK